LLSPSAQERVNKALVPIHGKPLFWWLLRNYARHGARRFILAAGLQSERFAQVLAADCQAVNDTAEGRGYLAEVAGHRCHIQVLHTEPEANTAQRLLACKTHLQDATTFALTYSDTLSDVDLTAALVFHRAHGTAASVVSTQYPVRFRILGIREGESLVRAFAPKPIIDTAAINGGFYLFNADVWNPIYGLYESAPLEIGLLDGLVARRQLHAFEHRGAWQHCDSERDVATLSLIAQRMADPAPGNRSDDSA